MVLPLSCGLHKPIHITTCILSILPCECVSPLCISLATPSIGSNLSLTVLNRLNSFHSVHSFVNASAVTSMSCCFANSSIFDNLLLCKTTSTNSLTLLNNFLLIPQMQIPSPMLHASSVGSGMIFVQLYLFRPRQSRCCLLTRPFAGGSYRTSLPQGVQVSGCCTTPKPAPFRGPLPLPPPPLRLAQAAPPAEDRRPPDDRHPEHHRFLVDDKLQ